MDPSEELYQRLIAPIERRMMAAVARIVRDPDEAADAFQAALERIWKHLPRIDIHPNPHAYILRLCVNAGYEALRTRLRREGHLSPLQEEQDVPAAGGNSRQHLADTERERRTMRAIASLPPQQADAVLLRLVDGRSFEEIAEAMGCRAATVRSHLSKGRARLQEILSEELEALQ